MYEFFSVMILFLPVTFAEVLPCPNNALQTIRLGYVSKRYTFGSDGSSTAGYNINQGCNWKIVATDPSARILYKLTKIYVDCGDVLKVGSKTVCCTSSSSSSASGCPPQGEDINEDSTASNELEVTFQADSTKRDGGVEGFTLLLTVGKDTTTSCSMVIQKILRGVEEVLITSPGFPGFYSSNLTCSFRIQAELNNRVSFNFTYLKLDTGGSVCRNDKVELFDGNTFNPAIRVLSICGNTAPYEVNKKIKSSGRHLTVKFTTDDLVSSRGFSAVVSQIVDGEWTSWGAWTTCSKTCGGGTQTSTRTCSDPPPSNGGETCDGPPSFSKQCNTPNCPVDGVWSPWGGWTTCSKTCGGGTRTRTRTCSNPPPSNGGTTCSGSSSGSEQCNTQNCPVDGVWSPWGGWTTCSKTCGGGTRTRTRTCSNPPPSNDGTTCSGSSSGSEQCNTQNCPVDGEWSLWGGWTVCTKSCGSGKRTRTRTCSNPPPSDGGAACAGASSGSESCNTQNCPTTPPVTTTTVATTATTTTVATTKPTTTTPPATTPSPSLPFIIFAVPFWLTSIVLLSIIFQLFG